MRLCSAVDAGTLELGERIARQQANKAKSDKTFNQIEIGAGNDNFCGHALALSSVLVPNSLKSFAISRNSFAVDDFLKSFKLIFCQLAVWASIWVD